MAQKLVKNSYRCLGCDTTLVSEYRHDFNSCDCGNLCIDGGTDYSRVLWTDSNLVEDLCEYEEE